MPSAEGHGPTGRANRLVDEKSPYLLQHAYNPVNWYPWGEEAFADAKAQDKPVLLSVGYSTCYWCHVMEQESFDNPEVARQLNEQVIAIKVDREERPDIDALYMKAVQAMTGSGGWPMTVFLTADGKPFWGGTYFPPEDRMGRPGLTTILRSISEAWRTRRQDILRSSESLTQAIEAGAALGEPAELSHATLEAGVEAFRSQDDATHGGFGPAPKFPRSHALSFLLGAWSRSRDAGVLAIVETTLTRMARGGIHDHLGGGFHRYSTDAQWLVPHFEKMLYDQALLARTYLEAFQATGRAEYAEVAHGIFEYVLRDLRDPGGAFYSAEDAGEVGREGEFYVWTPAALEQVLGAEEAGLIGRVFGVTPQGNFEHATTILSRPTPLEALAEREGMAVDTLRRRVAEARSKLLTARSQRQRPHRDDKILTDWNGLMIGSLAFGARVLHEPAYAQAAREAAAFVLERLRREGRLLHRYRDGDAEVAALLDDYAFLGWGLLELYEATFEPRWLKEAVRLTRETVELFWDEVEGGFFLGGDRNEQLVANTKDLYDGAIPSGNSVAALNLTRLGILTVDKELSGYAERLFRAFSGQASRLPHAFPQFLVALDFQLGPSQEIVIAGDPDAADTQAMLRALHERFLPRAVLALHPTGEGAAAIEALVPFMKSQVPQRGRATAYVCQNYVCNLPTTEVDQMVALLDGTR